MLEKRDLIAALEQERNELIGTNDYDLKTGILMGLARARDVVNEREDWIPLKTRPMTEEELQARSGYSLKHDITELYDCLLPEDGEEVLVTDGQFVTTDTFYWDDGCYFDGGDVWTAWMPLPKPYKVG